MMGQSVGGALGGFNFSVSDMALKIKFQGIFQQKEQFGPNFC